MSDTNQDLEKSVNDLIVELCTVLHKHGYQEVPVGALMRLMGVSDAKASDHDDQVMNLDNYFSVERHMPPPNTTFH
jgi:hypothetical protein